MKLSTVLIVDDTPANIAVLAGYMEDQKYKVVVAQDGEEALQRADYVRPDLILLDVMMPGIDGFEVCRRLKANDALSHIPVIFMTALSDTQSLVNGFKVGAVDYIVKPIQIEEVLARVKTHLSLRYVQAQLVESNQHLSHEIDARTQAEVELTKISSDQKQLINKLQEAQNQLLQSEKMASIGQLAAGIAHEINNPIGFVNSNLGSLQSYFVTLLDTLNAFKDITFKQGLQADVRSQLGQIWHDGEIDFLIEDFVELMKESKDGLNRVKEIVTSLKDFSHVGGKEWAETDLHKGIDSTLNIVNNEIKYKADVVKKYGQIPLVKCIGSQLNQVFMNLLVNAAHAMKERGTITISTELQEIDGVKFVNVEFADTGEGIPPEIKNRIFEPFFTTKPIGQGTGLGLSLSYGIIQKHKGKIEVDSQVGVGTRFKILLPVVPPQISCDQD
ncbi:response regulator [Undibacterium sp. CY7W]|uniref:histidine kinase n=1 Tax=Undibacterium rugosum TaxID=2762291 RepID=A0A923L0I7_9BURK|nr:response regulator [Undibacterium rugosum]MBC3936936.1 response regulator [Undibacterium rugosum]